MQRRPIFSFEQQTAFDAAAKEMRRRGGAMTKAEIFAAAKAKLNVVAKNWTPAKRIFTAEKIAVSISSRHDVNKSGKKPKHKRTDKSRRDLDIVKFYQNTASTFPPSYAEISAKFGISRSTAHRIIKDNQMTPSSVSPELSESANRLVFLMERAFPLHRCRLLKSKELELALDLQPGEVGEVIEELLGRNHPLQLIDTGVNTGGSDGSSWLIIQRGKGKSLAVLRQWAATKIDLMRVEPRARIDQKIVFHLSDALLDTNSVLADVCAVLEISLGSTNLQTWSTFVEASSCKVSIPSEDICIADVGGILTVLNGAIRRNNLDDKLPEMSQWVANTDDAVGAGRLFDIAARLRSDIYYPALDAVRYWVSETNYLSRVERNELLGRTVQDVNRLQSFAQIDDTAILIKELRAAFGSVWQQISEVDSFLVDMSKCEDGYIYPLDEE
jgi:hypothetical protein